jgi:hypothetical protein
MFFFYWQLFLALSLLLATCNGAPADIGKARECSGRRKREARRDDVVYGGAAAAFITAYCYESHRIDMELGPEVGLHEFLRGKK